MWRIGFLKRLGGKERLLGVRSHDMFRGGPLKCTVFFKGLPYCMRGQAVLFFPTPFDRLVFFLDPHFFLAPLFPLMPPISSSSLPIVPFPIPLPHPASSSSSFYCVLLLQLLGAATQQEAQSREHNSCRSSPTLPCQHELRPTLYYDGEPDRAWRHAVRL